MARTSLLSHFFTNQTMVDVLLFFLLQPSEKAYLSQIVDSTGRALILVQRTLKRLVETGLILKSIQHRKTYYNADLKHVAYEDIKQLIIKAKIFSDPFKEDIELLNNKTSYGFIFGSLAKGTNTPDSDIDIFLIGNLTYHDAGSFIFKLGRELSQEVNVAIFTPEDFLKGIKNKNTFILNVLNEPKIWLFGDKGEFEETYR